MKTLQVRNVPEDLHRTLKVRAAQQGRSLSDYLLEELRRIAEQPTMDEVLARIASREPVELSESAADMIHAERDAR